MEEELSNTTPTTHPMVAPAVDLSVLLISLFSRSTSLKSSVARL